MQIVIDIPEKYYKEIKNIHFSDRNYEQDLILNGTPLPKGHGRLIDADAVLEDPFGNTYKDLDIAETIVEADKEEQHE